jgi:hypothetical protein
MIRPDGSPDTKSASREAVSAAAARQAAQKESTPAETRTVSADEPMRGFDELKKAWQNRPR